MNFWLADKHDEGKIVDSEHIHVKGEPLETVHYTEDQLVIGLHDQTSEKNGLYPVVG